MEEMTSIFSAAPKITLIGLPPLFWASSITWIQAPHGLVGVAVSFLPFLAAIAIASTATPGNLEKA